jgi:Exonuclease VII, large subunit
MPEQNSILTPAQLNTLARDLLESAFPLVWVEGELGNVTRPASGHLYFNLKDSRAQVRCAMFKPKSQWLKFAPREGLKVLARGRLTCTRRAATTSLCWTTWKRPAKAHCAAPTRR